MVDEIARDALAVLGTRQQIPPFSSHFPSFGLADAYGVAEKVRRARRARGETIVGRGWLHKSGVWRGYGISAPIWNYMFDSTVVDLFENCGSFSVVAPPEPRIEPEIVFHLGRQPAHGMNEGELVDCIDWIAHGFEIVSSIFPSWTFKAADAVAAFGVHSALLISDKHAIRDQSETWFKTLASFSITLAADGVNANHFSEEMERRIVDLMFRDSMVAGLVASWGLSAGRCEFCCGCGSGR